MSIKGFEYTQPRSSSTQTRASTGSLFSMRGHVYIRVGPSGSGHTRFIRDIATKCDMKLFTKRTRTPFKLLNRQTTKFEKMIADCTEKKMVAFDNTPVKKMRYANTTLNNMCFVKNLKMLDFEPKCDRRTSVDTWVFSVNDKGMKLSGNDDAEDILVHLFGKDDLESRRDILYNLVTEIHYMLPNGTVRILASGGKKLEAAIVLSYDECIERVVLGHSA
jgi:hypothetical protein